MKIIYKTLAKGTKFKLYNTPNATIFTKQSRYGFGGKCTSPEGDAFSFSPNMEVFEV